MGCANSDSISTLSTEFVYVTMLTSLDPTTFPVWFAFTADTAVPEDSDWVSGSWETTRLGIDGYVTVAKALVGPSGGLVLAAGPWVVWIKVVAGSETPIKSCGTIRIVPPLGG